MRARASWNIYSLQGGKFEFWMGVLVLRIESRSQDWCFDFRETWNFGLCDKKCLKRNLESCSTVKHKLTIADHHWNNCKVTSVQVLRKAINKTSPPYIYFCTPTSSIFKWLDGLYLKTKQNQQIHTTLLLHQIHAKASLTLRWLIILGLKEHFIDAFPDAHNMNADVLPAFSLLHRVSSPWFHEAIRLSPAFYASTFRVSFVAVQRKKNARGIRCKKNLAHSVIGNWFTCIVSLCVFVCGL